MVPGFKEKLSSYHTENALVTVKSDWTTITTSHRGSLASGTRSAKIPGYLKEFRTEQCPLFVQHKCTQHRPYTCFHWHFVNQRRRRSIRRRDGTFNYSPDVYCTKYDEATGLCPEGDECPFLHRTTGDTERRYHLRYYKTGICIHETDSKGNCTKNGLHCAFAHGPHDLRSPVYDIRELQAMEALQNGQTTVEGSIEGQSAGAASHAMIEKILSEEPRWQETAYVLGNYKTEPCKKPPRLCRQGYACPYYHNSKDRRRSPRKHKYRSSPCPNVKHGDEWGDPGKCENGDTCQYCHTRTEQQFHPEAKLKSHSLEPRSQEQPLLQPKQDVLGILPVGSPLTSSISSSITSSLAATPPSPAGTSSAPGMNANALPFYPTSDTVESVIESALDDLDLNEFGVAALEKTFDNSTVTHPSNVTIGPLESVRKHISGDLSVTWIFRQGFAVALAVLKLRHPSASASRVLGITRDALELRVKKLQEELERLHTGPEALPAGPELEALSLSTLYSLQKQLRVHLEQVDKAVFHMQSVKCLKCQEQSRSVLPCQHAVLCELCAEGSECPVCQPSRAHALQS
ncbi:putative RING finger protein unkempt like protein [Cricetulus griseus]|nr:putative RING finger protein unkempt like protein [Cricetulus griseus]